MKKACLLLCLYILSACLSINKVAAQTHKPAPTELGVTTPWTENDLLQPDKLAEAINAGRSPAYVILNIGAVEDIKGAVHIGPAANADNLAKLKTMLVGMEKNTPLVIYCGCCPFGKCPNIRPAFTALKDLGFTQFKLLNLPTNLQTNWIAKGFPLAKH
jgi:hypothetical protein